MSQIIKRVISFAIDKKESRLFSGKMHNIFKKLLKNNLIISSKGCLKKHIAYWKRFGIRINSKSYLVFSSVSGIEDPLFVPEVVYYNQIEPRLNNRMMTLAYADKNIYEHYYSELGIFPKTLIRKIDGVIYDGNYQLFFPTDEGVMAIVGAGTNIIIKKTFDTGGGLEVGLFTFTENGFCDHSSGLTYNLGSLSSLYGGDFVIQEYINQHDFYRRFNVSSINTVRIFTYRSVANNQVIPIQSVVRIGRPGKIVDNQASGGISCGIKDGILNDFAVDKYGNKYYESNNVKFAEIGKAYCFDEMKELAIAIAQKQFYSRLLGFDFCVDSTGKVRLIEINNSNIETNFLQMNNGPLFGDYTDEVVNYCLVNPRTFCLDFRL